MDFRAPFPVGGGVDHVVVDVPFESGRHGGVYTIYYYNTLSERYRFP
jgi:hypothetical protein